MIQQEVIETQILDLDSENTTLYNLQALSYPYEGADC